MNFLKITQGNSFCYLHAKSAVHVSLYDAESLHRAAEWLRYQKVLLELMDTGYLPSKPVDETLWQEHGLTADDHLITLSTATQH